MSERVDYSALDRPEILSVVFYPRPDFRRGPANSSDHFITVDAGISISCRLYAHSPSSPTLIYFHGNGEVVSDYDEIAPLYHRLGINLFVADYRGYGASGGVPTLTHIANDAHPIFEGFERILGQQGYGGAVFAMGRSLGSIPALEIASRYPERIGGLVIESGFASMLGLMEELGYPAHLLGRVDPEIPNLRRIRSVTVPVLIIHGEDDEIIPVSQARTLFQAAAAQQKRLLVIPRCGHNDMMWLGRQEYFAAIKDFVGV